MTTVKDIMTKNVITCSTDTSIQEAARLMYLNGLTGLPILDNADKLVGIITEGDLVKLEGPLHLPAILSVLGSFIYLDNPVNGDEIEKQLHILTATKVQDLMSKDPVTVSHEASVTELAEIFLHKKVNPIPVMAGDRLVGIVSRADIVKLLAGEKDLARAEWKSLMKTE